MNAMRDPRHDLTAEQKESVRADIRARLATDQKAAVARARRVGRDTGMRDGVDLGPSTRSDLETEDRRDLSDTNAVTKRKDDSRGVRTVAAARVRCNLMTLFRARPRSIELWHVQAGYRWQMDWELGMEGATPPREPGQASDDSEPSDPEARRLNSVRRFIRGRDAILSAGEHLRPAIYYILKPVTVGECADKYRIDRATMTRAIAEALDLLAIYYDISKKVRMDQVDPLAP